MNKAMLEKAQNCIEILKIQYPNSSSSQIASKVGMPQSTFSRIENGQTNPSMESFDKLSTAAGHLHGTTIKLNELDLKKREEVLKNLYHTLDRPIMRNEYLRIRGFRYIMLLSLTDRGITRREIKRMFGSTALSRLEVLLNSDLLYEKDGVIKAKYPDDKEVVVFEQDIMKETLLDCIRDYYNPDLYGQGENLLDFQAESVDRKKVTKPIRQILIQAFKDIEKILENPDNYGKDVLFVGSSMGFVN